MFSRDPVGQICRFVQRLNLNDRAIVGPTLPRDVTTLQRFETQVNRRRHSLRQISIISDQDRLRDRVMLGLAQQIQRDPIGVVVLIGDHQNL